MFYGTPEAIVGETVFGDETMNMGIPFQRAPESMEDTDETGNKVFWFVHFMEHTENDASGCVKKAVEKGTVLKKKVTEPFINGKNAVTMGTLD